jgi:Rrf2 family protein
MTLLNRKVDYALLILAYLHQRRAGGCARAIADQFGLSRAFVANILKRLCAHGFVASQRGIKGGYSLARPAREIFLTEVLEALDAEFRLARCCRETPDDSCELLGSCPIRGPISDLHQRLREVLAQVTLAELAGPGAVPLELDVSRCQPA